MKVHGFRIQVDGKGDESSGFLFDVFSVVFIIPDPEDTEPPQIILVPDGDLPDMDALVDNGWRELAKDLIAQIHPDATLTVLKEDDEALAEGFDRFGPRPRKDE